MKKELKIVLTDIEGTTSAISFVKDVLFPYSYKNLPGYVYEHESKIQLLIEEVKKEENNMDLSLSEVIEIMLRHIDEDRKIASFKEIQGMILEDGFKSGEIVSHIYDDAYRGLNRFRSQGMYLYIYSSGSVNTQKLFFSNTEKGDLTPLFSGYFDTHIGSKKDPESYHKIADELGVFASEILFLSDNLEEILAADSVGMNVVIIDREGDISDTYGKAISTNFDSIFSSAHSQ